MTRGAAPHTGLETERKFEVDALFTLPALDDVIPEAQVLEPETVTLRATYFDTPDLRLAGDGLTLRRRTGGHDAGWHLKVPAGKKKTDAMVREEVTMPLGASGRVPAAMRGLVAAWVRSSTLAPVATLVTRRTYVRLCDADGRSLVDVTDDIVTTNGSAVTFREVEVEDVGGGAAAVEAVADCVEQAGATPNGHQSKLVRVLGERVEGAEVPEPGTVRRKDPVGALVVAALSEHVRSLRAHDPRVRLDMDDAVHQMRVSARRLRSVLKTFGPVLDEQWASTLRDELRWLGLVLGAARDAEVLAAGLDAALGGLTDDAAAAARPLIEAEMAARKAAATKSVRAALRSPRYLTLVDALVAAVHEPALLPDAEASCREAVPSLIRTSWDRLDRKAAKASRSQATDHQLHKARIAAKQARYATETAATAFGATAARLADQAERVQDVLGEQHDAVVAATEVAALSRRAPTAAAAFALGILHQQLLTKAGRHRDEFDEVWAEARRAKYRRWLA